MTGEPMTLSNGKDAVATTSTPIKPLYGEFMEELDDRHRSLRRLVLERREWFPEPAAMGRPAATVDALSRLDPDVRTALAETGLVRVVFDRPLSTDELLILADELGGAMPQAGTHTLPQYLESETVLNLVPDAALTGRDDSKILVSTNALNLHSELSRRPLSLQPRFLMLHCVQPPRRNDGGQTLLVAMANVAATLSDRQQRILRALRLRDFPDAPSIFRQEGPLPVFSFGDYESGALGWEYAGDEAGVTASEVNEALAATLAAMYDPKNVAGVEWSTGSVLIWDNWRYFHGRTRLQTSATQTRHLQRLYLGDVALQ